MGFEKVIWEAGDYSEYSMEFIFRTLELLQLSEPQKMDLVLMWMLQKTIRHFTSNKLTSLSQFLQKMHEFDAFYREFQKNGG